MNAGTVNGIIAKLTFRFMLLKRSYKKNEFEKMIAGTKFDDVEIRENLHRPGDIVTQKIVRRPEVWRPNTRIPEAMHPAMGQLSHPRHTGSSGFA